MVLVVVSAMDLDMPAVEEEAVVGIEQDRADAEGRLITVHHGAAGAERRHEPVERGRLQRPEPRLRDVERARKFARAARCERKRAHRASSDDATVGIHDILLHVKGRSLHAFIGHSRAR